MASSDAMQSADVPKSRFEKCISPPASKQNEAEENFLGAPALEKLERRLSLATVVQRFDDDSRAVRAVLHVRTSEAICVAASDVQDVLRDARAHPNGASLPMTVR